MQGKWCCLCGHDVNRLTLEDAQHAAAARGGRCLSTDYIKASLHLIWECDRGHVWKTSLQTVRNGGTWCPQCAHMARINNRKSKARLQYADVGKRLVE